MRVISPGAKRSAGRLMVATRIAGRSVAAAATRTVPPSTAAARTIAFVRTGPRIAAHANPLRHASSIVAADHAIRNVMPQMPATAASCIKG
jgi:hypothetical protein